VELVGITFLEVTLGLELMALTLLLLELHLLAAVQVVVLVVGVTEVLVAELVI
jgi:hypothetical protein